MNSQVWLATTRATIENGCLFVAPGSHRESIHKVIPDRRPGSNYGYMEVIDYDFSKAVPVLMDPGDVLVFHSFCCTCRMTIPRTSGAPLSSITMPIPTRR
jgi:ectoine hydroxylase-related dioxygenase (phytanoyl-CoA dioxygenase family)